MPSPKQILFFDIETAPLTLTEQLAEVRGKKYWKDNKDISLADHYCKNAGLYPEFSQVVCISYGFYDNPTGERIFNSFTGEQESLILKLFGITIATSKFLSGHNIKNFDIPFLMRKYIINKMKVPRALNTYGKKPRELSHIIDTMEIRKGTGFSSTSLEVCSTALGLPNPKEDTEGGDVATLFYNGEVDKIAKYCEGDVKATMRLYNELYKYL